MSNANYLDALRTIQTELKAPKSKFNKFGNFWYRSLEDILEGVKPLLIKHGATLTISDEVNNYGSMVVLTAKVVFTDSNGKQTIVSAHAGVEPKKGMDIAQAFGASSSYARKYALNGLFLIDDTQDPDTNAFHEQNNSQGQNNRNQNQGNTRSQNNGNRNQQSGNRAQNTRAQAGNQNQQNAANQSSRNQRTIHQLYNDALPAIQAAVDPSVLEKALTRFQNTQYSAGISNACRAKSDQMGWNLNILVSEIHNQYNQMHH